MRDFEKISFEQFKKDVKDDKELYDELVIPQRDSDYYNNPDNEGHIFVKIQNEGDKEVTIKKGDAIAQGIFMKYLITDSDNSLDIERRSDY